MPFCPGCGKQIQPGGFCPYCGRPQERPGEETSSAVPAAGPGAPVPPQPAGSSRSAGLPYRTVLWCSLTGVLALAVASAAAFLPWLEYSGVRVTGTDRDGWFTFALAIAGAAGCLFSALLRARWPFVLSLVCATALLAVAAFDAFDIVRTPGLSASSIGIGLWLTIGAGFLAVVACAAGAALAPGGFQR